MRKTWTIASGAAGKTSCPPNLFLNAASETTAFGVRANAKSGKCDESGMGRDESGTGWDESGLAWDESAARASTAGRHASVGRTKSTPRDGCRCPHALRRWAWTGIGSYKPKAVRPRARHAGCCVCFGRVPRLTALGFLTRCHWCDAAYGSRREKITQAAMRNAAVCASVRPMPRAHVKSGLSISSRSRPPTAKSRIS